MKSESISSKPLDDPEQAAKRWLEVRRQLKSLAQERDTIEAAQGFQSTKYVDHYDGTNMSEYRCLNCGRDWLASLTIPCPDCYPKFYSVIQHETI